MAIRGLVLRDLFVLAFTALLAIGPVAELLSQETATPAQVSKLTSRGIAFLRKMQQEDGSFAPQLGPGITSLVTTSLLRNGVSEQDPVVAKALRYIEEFIQDDGGVYDSESQFNYNNYETCLAMMCFAEVKNKERYKDQIARAQKFVMDEQWNDPQSTSHGGAGYGKHKRPDLSNTSFFIEALKSSGIDENDPHMQRALAFVSRTQNLESEHNTLPFAGKVNDGGFYYTGAAGGSSQAGGTPEQGLRSYGSMTYAGLKSMIYAGLKADDPRVKAASEWISRNYTLDQNPGMKLDGLFYYYHTFAKCLSALGNETLKDDKGVEHNWKAELIATLAEKQNDNGSWVNESDRWFEGQAELVTAYALMSLSYCKPATDGVAWKSLFDGKQLGDWKPTRFGGEGEVSIKDKQIKCDYGQYMTGVTYSGKGLPTNNYELELEAIREDGSDFFCGLTFPVDKSHASFIIGGWGGSVVGISSIDDMDASENNTTGYKVFKNGQWYKIRVRVTPNRLQAWINDEMFVDEDVDGERLSTRIEVDRSKPLGVCCFDTQAAFRNIRMRKVTEPAKK